MGTAISEVFAQLDRELWLLTAAAGERRGGLIATFVNQASIVPDTPRVVVGLARQHHTWELVEAAGAFALHLLGEDQLDLVWQFGLLSGRDTDKLAGLPSRAGVTGSPILTTAPAFLECRVEARLDTGDRTVYLAEVVAGELLRPMPFLTMKQLLRLAPAERLRQMKEELLRDAAVDAEAIRIWRARRD
ncbi:MAG TPA: flavin reductase family protein [Gemmataceae bacterium]|nr:flavin reductase family protein [Gemmataceae bacterium]